mgnify:FL=1|tara:strand:+ start:218 stop:433 length:216 start_codon:yes stop_codon:yes gene_type:complete
MILDMLWILSIIGAISCCMIVIVLTFLAGASDRCSEREQQAKDYEIILAALLEKIESQEKNRGKSENSDNS